jgi:hypothetical protein
MLQACSEDSIVQWWARWPVKLILWCFVEFCLNVIYPYFYIYVRRGLGVLIANQSTGNYDI